MVAFAANSVVTRLALSEVGTDILGANISAGQFALIRLLSGAVVLAAICVPRLGRGARGGLWSAGHWRGGASLFLYAACFSLAYIALPSGTGALILFGCVQMTMLGAGFLKGERLSFVQWLGLLLAITGLIWMLFPQDGLPPLPLWAMGFMTLAGVAWGVYSLLGKSAGAAGPTLRSAGHFIRAFIIAAILLPFLIFQSGDAAPNAAGIILALICGGITSGLGYAIWYSALGGLTASRAAIAQLTVPVLAAIGGLLFIAEPITARFILSSILVLGGVGIAMRVKTAQSTLK